MNDSDETSPSDAPEPGSEDELSNRFTTLTVALEGLLGVVGLVGGSWSGIGWEPLVRPDLQACLVGLAGGAGLVAANTLLLLAGGRSNPLYRWVFQPFRRSLLERLPPLTWEDITLVSAMSGLAEEIFFRGWLQSVLGLVPASILFGLVHVWGREGIGYGVYAIGMGAVLGGLFAATGSLWSPVLAHAVNNFLGLTALKVGWLPGKGQPRDNP